MEGAREVEESSYAAVHERQTASQPPRADEEKWRKAGKRKRARARARILKLCAGQAGAT